MCLAAHRRGMELIYFYFECDIDGEPLTIILLQAGVRTCFLIFRLTNIQNLSELHLWKSRTLLLHASNQEHLYQNTVFLQR